MQRTLVLIKPDALQRDLVGEILTRFERKGLQLVGIKMLRAPHARNGEPDGFDSALIAP